MNPRHPQKQRWRSEGQGPSPGQGGECGHIGGGTRSGWSISFLQGLVLSRPALGSAKCLRLAAPTFGVGEPSLNHHQKYWGKFRKGIRCCNIVTHAYHVVDMKFSNYNIWCKVYIENYEHHTKYIFHETFWPQRMQSCASAARLIGILASAESKVVSTRPVQAAYR
jgi:hypothetical protein